MNSRSDDRMKEMKHKKPAEYLESINGWIQNLDLKGKGKNDDLHLDIFSTYVTTELRGQKCLSREFHRWYIRMTIFL